MAFRFRFKILQEHREFLLKTAQSQMAAAQYRYEQAEERTERAKSALRRHCLEWEEKQLRGMSVGEHLAFKEYLAFLEQELLSLEASMLKTAEELKVAKDALVEREKQAEVMESLKEKDRELYQYTQIKREQKVLDETATLADYYRKKT
jgi:flagellar export protein FliJ